MKYCCVVGCNERSGPSGGGYKLYKLPTNPAMCKKWLIVCGRPDKIGKCSHLFVCSKHFSLAQYDEKRRVKVALFGFSEPKCFRGLKLGAIPDQHIPKLVLNQNGELINSKSNLREIQ